MGILITIEGGEFTGKTSLIVPALKHIFITLGIQTKSSREPGGTPDGERMREYIFQRLREGAKQSEIAPLMNQARRLHLDEVIIPFLGKEKEKKTIAILDRYIDSTVVYQGIEGGVPIDTIFDLEKEYVKGYYPDVTLITYFPQKVFAQTFEVRRVYSASDEKRSKNAWDEGEISKHLKRQKHYLSVPSIYRRYKIPRHFVLIDASLPPKEVVTSALIGISEHLQKIDISQKKLLQTFEKLWKKRVWKDVQKAWEDQQKIDISNLMLKKQSKKSNNGKKKNS